MPMRNTMPSKGVYVQPYKYNGKELDRMHGLDTYDYGARQYNPVTGRWHRTDPLCEKYYSTSPYAYCMNNPVRFIDPDGRDWLEAKGDRVYWYANNTGDRSKLKDSFAATSGAPCYQNSKYQTISGKGSTPEGLYKINLSDPNQMAKVDMKNGELLHGDGIERIPESWPTINPNIYYTYQDWGKHRARLIPIDVKTNRDENSFYMHDSEKGYTHGCIEIGPRFFEVLLDYIKNNTNEKNIEVFIEVLVNYDSKNQSTNGGTKKE